MPELPFALLTINNEEDEGFSSPSCLISELPVALLHEIFFRLPMKAVMRCKCVCPTWNNLLSTPSFTRNYTKYSPFTALLFFFYSDKARLAFFLLEIGTTGDDTTLSRIEQKFPYDDTMVTDTFNYLGDSNGLLLTPRTFADLSDAACLLNPTMGDAIQLPSCPQYPDNNCFVEYKFAFSPATNNFKVVRFVFKSINDHRILQCEIFTIGVDNTWRRLPAERFQLSLPYPACFVTLNGFFHWLPFKGGPECILTFDLAEEKFGRISVPPSCLLVSKPMDLVSLGDQLCIVDSFVKPLTQVTIWKMKRHLVVESWTKVVVLTSWFPPEVPTSSLIVVAELRNGDILFQSSDDCLVSCNIEQKRCSIITSLGEADKIFIARFMPGYSPNFAWHPSLMPHSHVTIKREVRSSIAQPELGVCIKPRNRQNRPVIEPPVWFKNRTGLAVTTKPRGGMARFRLLPMVPRTKTGTDFFSFP